MQQEQETYTLKFDKHFLEMILEGFSYLPHRMVVRHIQSLQNLKSDQQVAAEQSQEQSQEKTQEPALDPEIVD